MVKKIAVCTICFNEEDIIRACIKNWKGLVDKHLVLVSSIAWDGEERENDNTSDIAKQEGAEVIVGYWENEEVMRNWGLARLYDYDYVLIVDPDELYTKEDQQKILKRLNDSYDYVNKVMKPMPAFRAERMITYWKSTDYVFDPPDKHQPFIAVDPKKVRFWDKRELMGITREPIKIEYSELISIIIYHLSWVKSDKKVKEKIDTYSHSKDIIPSWFEEVWIKWNKESLINIRPYGEKSIAKYQPAPDEICELLNG